MRILTEGAVRLLTENGQGLMLEGWTTPLFNPRRVVRLRSPRPIRISRSARMVDTPHRWEDKDPSDVWPYGIDFTGWCAAAGETAASLAVSASPSGLTIGSWTVTEAGMAAVELAGGAPGTDYAVQVTLTTASARVLERTIMIKVRDL